VKNSPRETDKEGGDGGEDQAPHAHDQEAADARKVALGGVAHQREASERRGGDQEGLENAHPAVDQEDHAQ